MIRCPKCGHENPTDTEWCSNCRVGLAGAPIAETEEENATPPFFHDYLVLSILATVFCCLPFGVVAIVYSAMARAKWSSKDYAGAADLSGTAGKWAWAAVIGGLITLVMYFVIQSMGSSNVRYING